MDIFKVHHIILLPGTSGASLNTPKGEYTLSVHKVSLLLGTSPGVQAQSLQRRMRRWVSYSVIYKSIPSEAPVVQVKVNSMGALLSICFKEMHGEVILTTLHMAWSLRMSMSRLKSDKMARSHLFARPVAIHVQVPLFCRHTAPVALFL